MSKPAKTVRSTEQIIHDEKVKKETERQRTLVKEKIVPILNGAKDINEAKFSLLILQNTLKAAFDKLIQGEQVRLSGEHLSTISSEVMAQMTVMKVGDKDKIINDITVNDLMFAFKDEPLGTVDALLRGMTNEIEQSLKEELSSRKFESLELKLL